jgi:hypothetical protein
MIPVRCIGPMAWECGSVRRKLTVILFVIGVILLVVGVTLSFHFASTEPVKPNPAMGQIHEMNFHGKFVYLTAAEQWARNSTFLGALIAGAAAVFIEISSGRK